MKNPTLCAINQEDRENMLQQPKDMTDISIIYIRRGVSARHAFSVRTT